MQQDFECHTQRQQAKSIADYLPNGPVFEAKNVENTTLKNLLLGWAVELISDETVIKEVSKQHDIRQTVDLIEEWESMMGIPDDCFKADGTIEERRRDVIIKLGIALLTEQDYIDLGKLFDIEVKIARLPPCLVFPLLFPVPFCVEGKKARFTMIIELPAELDDCIFPVLFPVCFRASTKTLIECLFRKLSPANVRVIFKYIL